MRIGKRIQASHCYHDRDWEDTVEDWEVDEKTTLFGAIPGRGPKYKIPGCEHLLPDMVSAEAGLSDGDGVRGVENEEKAT